MLHKEIIKNVLDIFDIERKRQWVCTYSVPFRSQDSWLSGLTFESLGSWKSLWSLISCVSLWSLGAWWSWGTL